jgi:hypothetical protein
MYEKAVSLARQQTSKITHKTAEMVKAARVKQYEAMELDELAQRLEPALLMQLRYLESGNIDEWKQYCTQVITERTNQGLDYTMVIKAGQLLVEALGEFFKDNLGQLDTIENTKPEVILQRIQRRLNGLSMVATSVATAIGIQQSQNKE